MPDACAAVCAEQLSATQAYVRVNGKDQICQAPSLSALTSCLQEIPSPLGDFCSHNPFMAKSEIQCGTETVRRLSSLAVGQTLEDGTTSIDLDSLSLDTRMWLSTMLAEKLNDPRLTDLSGVKLLYNSTGGDAVVYTGSGPSQIH